MLVEPGHRQFQRAPGVEAGGPALRGQDSPCMPAAEKKRSAEGEFLAKDLSIWRQPPGPEADAGSRSRIQASVLWGGRHRASCDRATRTL